MAAPSSPLTPVGFTRRSAPICQTPRQRSWPSHSARSPGLPSARKRPRPPGGRVRPGRSCRPPIARSIQTFIVSPTTGCWRRSESLKERQTRRCSRARPPWRTWCARPFGAVRPVAENPSHDGPTSAPEVGSAARASRAHPMRGRAAETAAIGARLDEVRSGVGSVIIVEGRAGLGKTRLLEACASMAAERSFRVGRGVAEPHRRAVELDALFDALFGGGEPLLARNALSDLHASPEQRFWLLQDIQALIEEAALRDPLLICLDDLHWAGDGCAVAMRQLPQRLASFPVGWVIAFRPDQGLQPVQAARTSWKTRGPS